MSLCPPYKNKNNQILIMQYLSRKVSGQHCFSWASQFCILNITGHHNFVSLKEEFPNTAKYYAKAVNKSALKLIMTF